MLSEPIHLSLDLMPDAVEALDAWIAMQPPPTLARADAIAYALRDWLTGLGLLPFYDDPGLAY